MRRSSKTAGASGRSWALQPGGDAQLKLKIGAGVLAALNLIALFLYIFPPGGSRAELEQEIAQLSGQLRASHLATRRVATTAAKVQAGSEQASGFETLYFLDKRRAYVALVEEIQRMAKAADLQVRDGVFTKEPIEGSADLEVLNSTANYEGSYTSLMRFLHEVDHSPMLLMLDALAAAPQQKSGQINTSIRFQAVVRDASPGAGAGGQP
jgi:hypothetical protein